ncbi:hypothetical protein FACS1894172_03570 [Spirochaetia bacterium]|nr:hypothetical protein FACS1894164_16140 [Spirochaetia bacterium]GHU30388.1 hypothetical protein FACS1894172_03570 [Spirochaetia bacterium]
MKRIIAVLVSSFVVSTFCVAQTPGVFRQEGVASWYGTELAGSKTASGEVYDPAKLTAAHQTIPFGTLVTVTNKANNRTVTVRINDRGPLVPDRIIDLSQAAAEQLDMIDSGIAVVSLESATAAQEPGTLSPDQTTGSPEAQTAVANIKPGFPQLGTGKRYRIQVGSFLVVQNAKNAFDILTNMDLEPAYERFEKDGSITFYRVVLTGIKPEDVPVIAEKLATAGFLEALIREER